MQAPWNCDYHTDINVQMNYWPWSRELSECYEPLHRLIASLVEPGRTARIHYDADGWVLHPITNWGYTSPGEHPAGVCT